jgi:hypothetical protein
MARVLISGPMVDSTPEDGKSIRCMVAEPSLGPMAANMLVTTLMTKNRVSELSLGPTIGNMMDSGSMVNKKA